MSTSAARLIGGRGYPRLALDWMASEHPGKRLATAEIAEKLEIAPNDVFATLCNLVAAGYLQKEPDPGDKRRMRYWITAEGIEHSKLLAQARFAAPVKLHTAKTLGSMDGDGAAEAPASDAQAPGMPDNPDAVDPSEGGASTAQNPDAAQPETRQQARLAHKTGRPLFVIGPTGEVRVLLSRPGLSVHLQPDVLHKLAAASALVRQAGGLA